MSFPFKNAYRLRKVAETDCKACFVCYKPTSGVLVSGNQKDFFYVCLSHLKDTQGFCKPVLGNEPDDIDQQIAQTKEDIQKLEFLIKEKTQGWSFLKLGGKKQTKEEKEKQEKELAEKKKELIEKKKELVESEKQRDKSVENCKDFVLNADIYKIRLSNYHKKIANQKRLEQIASPEFFPSVPKSDFK